jgi:hypothetical protein
MFCTPQVAGLAAWCAGCSRALDFPVGVVLLTGTVIMPPPVSPRAGEEAIIATTGLDELRNLVEVAGPLAAGGGG